MSLVPYIDIEAKFSKNNEKDLENKEFVLS